MKKTLIIASLCILAGAAFAQSSLTSMQTLTSVNGTNTGTGINVNGVNVPTYTFHIQSLGITNPPVYVTNVVSGSTNIVNTATNAIQTKIQVSLDNTNWVTLATFKPTSTNSLIDACRLPSNSVTMYMRSQVITTNALTVGVMRQ